MDWLKGQVEEGREGIGKGGIVNREAIIERVAAASIVYHGTTAEAGRKIEKNGVISSRGDNPGNWGGGMFGGNPSNPNLVYAAIDKAAAISYMKQVCRKAHAKEGALVTAKMDWKYAVPDEDAVFEWMNDGLGGVARKLWEIYRDILEQDFPFDGSLGEFRDAQMDYWAETLSDAEVAEDMKTISESAVKKLSPSELDSLFGGTVASKKSLRVLKVEFMRP
jgi:hypothetical protein